MVVHSCLLAHENNSSTNDNFISLNMTIFKYSLYNSYFRSMSKKRRRRFSKAQLHSQILAIFRKHSNKSFNYKQLSKQIGIGDEAVKMLVQKVLKELNDHDKIIEISRGKYKANIQRNILEGTIEITKSGNGYVMVDQLNEDIFVHRKHIPHLLNGDLVEVSIISSKKSRRLEGIINNVIRRNTSFISGKLEKRGKITLLKAANPSVFFDVVIPFEEAEKLENGLLVVCKIIDWGNKKTKPSGKIERVLGKAGSNSAEIESILVDYNIDNTFENDVEQAAQQIDSSISETEISNRKDFRKINTFTIDPFDAKDFDDALSVQFLENGNTQVGIHIADVTHYIKKDDIIDKEAQQRATSIYLVDRVIPMLPEVLSNQLCSLRPNEDKLTFSAIFELDNEAKNNESVVW